MPVLTELKNGVFYVTMNRPEALNACNDELLLGLQNAFKQAEKDDAIRVIVLTGAGRAFCAGQDLKELSRDLSFKEHIERDYNPVILKMRLIEKPVITAVNGVAAGAGASLALAGDIRIWSEHASLIEVFSKIGLVPDSGSTWLLPRLVGYHRAFELMTTARKVDSKEAVSLGICEHMFSADQFETEVKNLAEKLASGPTKAFGLTKRALNKAMSATLPEALAYEAMLQEIAGHTDDYKEGVNAFLEKRLPEFHGR